MLGNRPGSCVRHYVFGEGEFIGYEPSFLPVLALFLVTTTTKTSMARLFFGNTFSSANFVTFSAVIYGECTGEPDTLVQDLLPWTGTRKVVRTPTNPFEVAGTTEVFVPSE